MFFLIGCFVKNIQRPTPHHEIDICSRSEFFITEFINKTEYTSHKHSQSIFLSVSQLNLNPGPFYNLKPLDHEEWNNFKHRVLHFLHLNINSLLAKIDEYRHIARLTNANINKISQSKLDDFMLTSEIQIYECDLLHCGRKKHGGGGSCCIKMIQMRNQKSFRAGEVSWD